MNIINELHKAIAKAGGTQTAFAKQHGISLAYVNDVLQGRRKPGQKILDALGLEVELVARRKPKQRT